MLVSHPWLQCTSSHIAQNISNNNKNHRYFTSAMRIVRHTLSLQNLAALCVCVCVCASDCMCVCKCVRVCVCVRYVEILCSLKCLSTTSTWIYTVPTDLVNMRQRSSCTSGTHIHTQTHTHTQTNTHTYIHMDGGNDTQRHT